jgi:hypothetical protein
MTPALLIVHATELWSIKESASVMVQAPASTVVANPEPETVNVVPGAEGGPGIGGDPLEGETEMVAAAFTVSNAFSAVTNSAMTSMRRVTAYRVRRKVSKSKHTSLRLFD